MQADCATCTETANKSCNKLALFAHACLTTCKIPPGSLPQHKDFGPRAQAADALRTAQRAEKSAHKSRNKMALFSNSPKNMPAERTALPELTCDGPKTYAVDPRRTAQRVRQHICPVTFWRCLYMPTNTKQAKMHPAANLNTPVWDLKHKRQRFADCATCRKISTQLL